MVSKLFGELTDSHYNQETRIQERSFISKIKETIKDTWIMTQETMWIWYHKKQDNLIINWSQLQETKRYHLYLIIELIKLTVIFKIYVNL